MFGSTKHQHIGVLGLGIIGSRVAECLRQAGQQVYVWNRTPKPEANFLASPAEVAEVAGTLQIFVSDHVALREVMEQLLPALTDRHLILCHSTVSPEAMKEAAALAASRGAAFLDAPFTGSRGAAELAELVYYLGGDEALLERAKKVLQHSSKKVLYFGGLGDASLIKICTNTLSAAVVSALAESLSLVRAHGIAPEHLMEALSLNANFSPLVSMKFPAMLRENFSPNFSTKNMLKDVKYGQDLAQEKGLSLSTLDSTADQLSRAVDQGFADEDFCALIKTHPQSPSA